MKNTDHKNKPKEKPTKSVDPTLPDSDADKTGTDDDADNTDTGTKEKGDGSNKFSKPKREPNPDRTGIDTDADKTKKEQPSK